MRLPDVMLACEDMHALAVLERPDANPVSVIYRRWQLHASTAVTLLQGKRSALTSRASLPFEMRALLRSEAAFGPLPVFMGLILPGNEPTCLL